MLAFDSPGSVSKALMIALLSTDPTMMRGADAGHTQRKYAARVFCARWRSELVGCGVRLGHINCLPASLGRESARSMPIPTANKNRYNNTVPEFARY